RIIDQNADVLARVCRQHYKNLQVTPESEAKVEERIEALSTAHQIDFVEGQIAALSFDAVRAKFSASIESIHEKAILYHAFVHMLRPFFLDSRGEKKRGALLQLLGVSETEERFIIESLMNGGLLGRTGNLLFVMNKGEAISALSFFVD